MCGKNVYSNKLFQPSLGSPPRVREKLLRLIQILFQLGITPACAGKTLPKRSTIATDWDHPRVCGKNFGSSAIASKVPGSPPRVREKLW